MKLSENYLEEGRVLITDNYYTSLHLAEALLHRKTHTVETLKQNRKWLPREVISAKIKRKESLEKKTRAEFFISKWEDKRDYCTLS